MPRSLRRRGAADSTGFWPLCCSDRSPRFSSLSWIGCRGRRRAEELADSKLTPFCTTFRWSTDSHEHNLMYTKTLFAGWADIDFNAHMKNTAYLDKTADVRHMYMAENGFAVEEFLRLGIGPVVMKDE